MSSLRPCYPLIILGKPGDLHPGYVSLREKNLVSFA